MPTTSANVGDLHHFLRRGLRSTHSSVLCAHDSLIYRGLLLYHPVPAAFLLTAAPLHLAARPPPPLPLVSLMLHFAPSPRTHPLLPSPSSFPSKPHSSAPTTCCSPTSSPPPPPQVRILLVAPPLIRAHRPRTDLWLRLPHLDAAPQRQGSALFHFYAVTGRLPRSRPPAACWAKCP
ncbi:hypothetical protein HU200_020142 [Digitaria exilis]|uniref:Uncharacterized protein n=1 Tax=Digitaria exilis TaxID=1010633 RepID=A0A835KGU8_9POAL|nr:hypothetical protein HU200_020142 [Digitaria exilis]